MNVELLLLLLLDALKCKECSCNMALDCSKIQNLSFYSYRSSRGTKTTAERRVRRDHKCISASSRHFCLNGVNASWIRKGQSCKKPSILDSLTLLWELAASTVQSFLTPSQATSHKSTTNLLSCPQLKREREKLNIRSHRIWKEQEDDLRYVKELYCVATHRSIMQVQ